MIYYSLFFDIWLFVIVHNARTSAEELNSGLKAKMDGHP